MLNWEEIDRLFPQAIDTLIACGFDRCQAYQLVPVGEAAMGPRFVDPRRHVRGTWSPANFSWTFCMTIGAGE